MKIEQIYTGCLAQGAYYIESEGEVAIIDPLREVDDYIERAEKNGAKIKYIFETHFHADFVSGHLSLAEKTGAKIIYGPSANPNFDAYIASDEEVFSLGKLKMKALHTPGHTLESTTYLLLDEDGKEQAIFTGDTLFLGDVGRPDLAQKANDITQEDLAGMLFDSLRSKIMTLPNHVMVYPAHGAGSACGKNMSSETMGLLGEQKKSNYALRADMTREDFIAEVTDGLLPPPAYFPLNVKMNKEGYEPIDEVLERGQNFLAPEAFEKLANETGAMILDVRHQSVFIKAFVPKSIFIGIDGGFAPWVGAMVKDVKQKLLIVADEGREEEVLTRLSRVGFDQVLGFLKGGIKAWQEAGFEVDSLVSIPATELQNVMAKEEVKVVDVRKPSEYEKGHIPKVLHYPLDYINDYFSEFPKNETAYIHCAGGYRSVIASSILKARGIHNVVDVAGGFKAIKEAGFEIEVAAEV